MKNISDTRRAMMARSMALAAAGALAGNATASATVRGGPYRVAFQVSDSDPKKWTLTLNNVKNVHTDLGPDNVSIEIVTYGPGIDMLKAESEVANRIQEALAAGIGVFACQHTMHGQHLKPEDMIEKIGFVPSGVIALIKRQAEGWSYIRS